MPPRPMPTPSYDPVPWGAPVDLERSTEGERRRRQRSRSPSLERLRDDAHRSRRPATESLEDVVTRLREENESLRRNHLTQRHETDRIRLERDQLRELIDTFPAPRRETPKPPPPSRREEPRASHQPYPRPSTVTRDRRAVDSRESSVGPDRTRHHRDSPPRQRPSSSRPARPAPPPSSFIPPLPSSSRDASSRDKGKEAAKKPWSMADGYLELEDDDDNDYDVSEGEMERREKFRQTRVSMKAARDAKRKDPHRAHHYPTNRELHGDWSGVVIETQEDFEKLSSATHLADEYAIGYIHYLNATHQVPSARRSPGVTILLRNYASFAKGPHSHLMERYKERLLKARRAAEIHDDAPVHAPDRAPLSEGAQDAGDIENYQSMSPTYHQGELPPTYSPIPGDSTVTTGMSNPRDPHQRVGREWALVPVHSWPRGMRIHDEGRDPRVPTEADGNTYQTPCLSDVQAVRYLVELSPARRHQDASTKLARRAWQHLFRDLFSIPGLYRYVVGQTQFPLGNRRRERFPFDTRNMDIIHVAIWAHDHGLDPQSPTVEEIEDWAIRIREEADSRLTDNSWASSPASISEVARTYQRQLSEIGTMFQYPPRSVSVHARSWATASELYVDQQREMRSLARLLTGVTLDDEDLENASMQADHAAPANGQNGEGLAKGG